MDKAIFCTFPVKSATALQYKVKHAVRNRSLNNSRGVFPVHSKAGTRLGLSICPTNRTSDICHHNPVVSRSPPWEWYDQPFNTIAKTRFSYSSSCSKSASGRSKKAEEVLLRRFLPASSAYKRHRFGKPVFFVFLCPFYVEQKTSKEVFAKKKHFFSFLKPGARGFL